MSRPRYADKKHTFSPPGGHVKVSSAADIGTVIREKRVAAGLTIGEAAPLCNVGTRFLSELERGKTGAELGKVLAVAEGLGLDLLMVPRPNSEDETVD